MTINTELLKKGLKITNNSVSQIPKGIKIKYRSPAILNDIELKSDIHLGAYSYFDKGRIGSLHSIGNYCSVAPGCNIGNGNHPTDFLTSHPIAFKAAGSFYFDKRVKEYAGGISRTKEVISSAPVIGNDVWIGGNVTILRGVKIGNGAIIGAHTVVNKDVPDFAIVAGAPMKILRYRFSDAQIERLLSLSWWNYDLLDIEHLSFDQVDRAIEQLQLAIDNKKIRAINETRPWILHQF